jgi:hypothetical protein
LIEWLEFGDGQAVSIKWDAQSLRFTFFPHQATPVSADWWTAFAHQPPEAENNLPRQHIVSISGMHKGVGLALASSPDRVDLSISPPPLVQGQIAEVTAGDAKELLAILREVVLTVKDRVPASRRLAIAGALFRQTASNEETYSLLRDALKSVTVVPEKMRDLSYRVNWPIQLSGRSYNRLGTWSSLLVKHFSFSPTGEAQSPLAERHYLSFEFDINTALVAGVEFQATEVSAVLDQMEALVTENMEKGEVISP